MQIQTYVQLFNLNLGLFLYFWWNDVFLGDESSRWAVAVELSIDWVQK